MFVDQALARSQRSRVVFGHAGHIVIDAWSGIGEHVRAGLLAAQGELRLAAACAGGGWSALADGHIPKALEFVHQHPEVPGTALLEAEALFQAGAVTMALERLGELHRQGDPGASLALARHRHELGDHAGAMHVAATLPMHAHAATIGARAAVAHDEPRTALRFIEPLLHGLAPIPDAPTAGLVTMVVAHILAKLEAHERLVKFVDRILLSGDVPEQMLPTLARAAWTAGRASEAWTRCSSMRTPWAVGAKLELAMLCGDLDVVQRMVHEAGPVAEASAPALRLLSGHLGPYSGGACPEVMGAGKTVHIWRTHPHRWDPWIEAAMQSPADVCVYDLARGERPPEDEVPETVLDDGALIDMVTPVQVPKRPPPDRSVWVGKHLCKGVGPKHDVSDKEEDRLRAAFATTRNRDDAAIRVTSAREALEQAREGRPAIVIATPGDPFWAGPIPESVWPSMMVVRSDRANGWEHLEERVKTALGDLRADPATRE